MNIFRHCGGGIESIGEVRESVKEREKERDIYKFFSGNFYRMGLSIRLVPFLQKFFGEISIFIWYYGAFDHQLSRRSFKPGNRGQHPDALQPRMLLIRLLMGYFVTLI